MAFKHIANNYPMEITKIESAIQESVNENLNTFAFINSEVTITRSEPIEIAFDIYRRKEKKTLTITVEVDITDTNLTFARQ